MYFEIANTNNDLAPHLSYFASNILQSINPLFDDSSQDTMISSIIDNTNNSTTTTAAAAVGNLDNNCLNRKIGEYQIGIFETIQCIQGLDLTCKGTKTVLGYFFTNLLQSKHKHVRLHCSKRINVFIDTKSFHDNQDLNDKSVIKDYESYISPQNRILIDKLNHLIKKSGQSQHFLDLRESLIIALGSIACIAEGKMFIVVLISIVRFLTSDTLHLREIALSQLYTVSQYRRVSLSKLFNQSCMQELAYIIVKYIPAITATTITETTAEVTKSVTNAVIIESQNIHNDNSNSADNLKLVSKLKIFSNLLGFNHNVSMLFKKTLKYILSVIVCNWLAK